MQVLLIKSSIVVDAVLPIIFEESDLALEIRNHLYDILILSKDEFEVL
jgi:hypothetical protein